LNQKNKINAAITRNKSSPYPVANPALYHGKNRTYRIMSFEPLFILNIPLD